MKQTPNTGWLDPMHCFVHADLEKQSVCHGAHVLPAAAANVQRNHNPQKYLWTFIGRGFNPTRRNKENRLRKKKAIADAMLGIERMARLP